MIEFQIITTDGREIGTVLAPNIIEARDMAIRFFHLDGYTGWEAIPEGGPQSPYDIPGRDEFC